MCHWCCKCDVAHALTAYDALRHKFTVLIDGCFTAAYTLVLCVMRVNVFYWSKNTLTEQAITFWLLCAVVDRFWLGDFTVTPFKNVVRACDCKAYGVKVRDIHA